MQFEDRLTLDAPKRTKEGFLAVRAKAARAGVYDYLGAEVDPEGSRFKPDQVVKVYRSADEVFDKSSVGSFFAKPITENHPTKPVTKDNWRDHARGAIMGALRDGEYLAFDLTLMDAGAIEAVDSGKRELSNGYDCDLAFEDGVAPDGTAYQAVQRKIRGNHVAIVDRARAGSECRIVDGVVLCDDLPIEQMVAMMADRRKPNEPTALNSPQDQLKDGTMPHTLIVDGLQVPDVSDAAKVAIEKLQGQVKDANTQVGTLTVDLAAANTTVQTRDGEIVALNAKLKDAEVTPERLQQLADARAKVIADAKTIDTNVVTDGKTDAEIKKAAVTAKLGDAAKDMADATIDGAFRALVATPTNDADPLRGVIAAGPRNVGDAKADVAKARATWLASKSTAYRGQAA